MSVVHVDLTRSDLVSLHIRLSIRHKSTWIYWLVVAVLIAAVIAYQKGVPTTPRNWMAMLVAVVVGSSAAIAVGFVLSTMSIIFMSKQSNGILGRHTYTIRDDGLLEQTRANETLVKWGGAVGLRRTRDLLLIEVGPALFHVIPRRSFENDSDFEAFWRAVQRLRPGDG